MVSIFIFLFVAGLIGGFISGLIGVGGGIIYVAILPEALHLVGIPQTEIPSYTIANSLVTIFLGSVLVNINHFKTKIYYKELIFVGVASSVASLLSLRFFVNTAYYSLSLFNTVTVILLLLLLLYTITKTKYSNIYNAYAIVSYPKLILVGIMGGLIASFSGLGGGIIVIPLLVYLLHYDFKIASVISSGVILVTSFFTSIYSLIDTPWSSPEVWHLGYIVLPIVAALYTGVLCTSKLGVNLSKKLSSKQINIVYTLVLLIVIFKKMMALF